MHDELNRRRFHELSVAALGGLMAGSISGCTKQKKSQIDKAEAAKNAEAAAKADLHVCRGLNACRGKGKGGNNECAGTSVCSTFATHECAELNECKGQGGCGEKPGLNQCKGKGACQVPLMEHAWEKVRKALEAKVKESTGKELGKAPSATLVVP